MRVVIDQDLCQGHQICAIVAPDVFGSDEMGNGVVLLPGELPDDLRPRAQRAAGNCPEQAISFLGDP